jgi:phenylpyruvate tautomerase PptA (4-oxalocrotonate tautomerase family)
MPLIRIDLVRGRDEHGVRAVADAIHAALVDVLDIPERDRFQVITEHEPGRLIALDAGLGFERGSNALLVQIITQEGRSIESKQRVYRALADRLQKIGIAGHDLFVSYVENTPADWSFADGRAHYIEGDLAVPGSQGLPRAAGQRRTASDHNDKERQ